jgi:hypothetical protein
MGYMGGMQRGDWETQWAMVLLVGGGVGAPTEASLMVLVANRSRLEWKLLRVASHLM